MIPITIKLFNIIWEIPEQQQKTPEATDKITGK